MAEFPKTLEQQNDDLRRFVKKIVEYDWSDHEALWAWWEAQELLILYGDPDVAPPRGVLNGCG